MPCAQASASSTWPITPTASADAKRPGLRQHLAEIAASTYSIARNGLPLVHREVIDRDDVRMRAATRGASLTLEAGEIIRLVLAAQQIGADQLDRHLAVDDRIMRR